MSLEAQVLILAFLVILPWTGWIATLWKLGIARHEQSLAEEQKARLWTKLQEKS